MAHVALPDGHHVITSFFMVEDAARFIEFLKLAFGAELVKRFPRPDGKIGHAEMKIGDSVMMLSEAAGEWRTAAATYLYVDDTDTTYASALAAGAISLTEPKNQFYGARLANVKDPFGNFWFIVTPLQARAQKVAS